jgi:hypothetical protein
MVCQTCRGAFTLKHNSRTCPMNNTIVPLTAIECYFPVIAGDPKIIKSPKSVKKVKKVTKSFEPLHQCAWMFEEDSVIKSPKSVKKVKKVTKVKKAKKVTKSFEPLRQCAWMFEEAKDIQVSKVSNNQKTCSGCGEKGHNSRTCINACLPCSPPTSLCFAGLTATQACTLTKVMDCHPAY